MALFPAGSCLGASTWKVDNNGYWFPTGQSALTPGCVVATQFVHQGQPFTVSPTRGLMPAEVHALKLKFPGAILPIDAHHFDMPLVPAGSPPIDID